MFEGFATISWNQNCHCFCFAVLIVAVMLDTLTIYNVKKFAIVFTEESTAFSKETFFQIFFDLFSLVL
jgi:hypothetical protein